MSSVLTGSARDPANSDPPEQRHGSMVIDMEESDLAILLAQDENHLQTNMDEGLTIVITESAARRLAFL